MKVLTLFTFIGFCSGSLLAKGGGFYAKEEFTIELPEGWEEIPRSIIVEYEQNLVESAPNYPAQHYDYAFQLRGAETWFQYPYIMVQVQNIGRIPEKKLNSFDDLSSDVYVNEHKGDLRSILTSIDIGKMYYESAENIIWMKMESEVIGVGLVSGLSGMVQTELGFIQVGGYCQKDEFTRYEKVFREITLSLSPSQRYQFKSRLSDNLPLGLQGMNWANIVQKTILGTALSAVLFLFISLRRNES